MRDRIPLNPGRVKLTPVTGETDLFDMEMADDPIELGTALNKANLLTDATAATIAAAFGSTPDTPNEAFALLAGASNMEYQEYVGNGTYGSWTNCTSITFAHEPKMVFIVSLHSGGYASAGVDPSFWLWLIWSSIKARYAAYPTDCVFPNQFNGNNNCKYRLSNDNKTIEFYATSSYNQDETQMNTNGNTYAVISFY